MESLNYPPHHKKVGTMNRGQLLAHLRNVDKHTTKKRLQEVRAEVRKYREDHAVLDDAELRDALERFKTLFLKTTYPLSQISSEPRRPGQSRVVAKFRVEL